MKKLIILCLAISIVSTSWGQTASFRVAADDIKDSYEYSDTITIELVTDFDVSFMGIDYIYGEPTASSPVLHPAFTQLPLNPGNVVNSGGILIQSIAGGAVYYIPAGEVLWHFEYHIPDVPESTILTISADGYVFNDGIWFEPPAIIPLDLHVVPEPMSIALLGLGGLLLRRRK